MAAFLEKRYDDAYRAARKVSTWGTFVLIVCVILGVIDILISFVALAGASANAISAVSGVMILGGGLAIMGTGCITNLLTKAAAHLLITTTDTAVNTSPFMNHESKWQALTSQKPALETGGNERVGTIPA